MFVCIGADIWRAIHNVTRKGTMRKQKDIDNTCDMKIVKRDGMWKNIRGY